MRAVKTSERYRRLVIGVAMRPHGLSAQLIGRPVAFWMRAACQDVAGKVWWLRVGIVSFPGTWSAVSWKGCSETRARRRRPDSSIGEWVRR